MNKFRPLFKLSLNKAYNILEMRTAAQLNYGEKAVIEDIDNDHPSSRRIMEIGFTPGQEIEMMSDTLFRDPIALSVRGTVIAIRKSEASCIIIHHKQSTGN